MVAEDSCNCGEREMRDILMQIVLENDIHTRFDFSGEFFEQYGKRNESIRKQVGLYEFKNVEQGIICAICINPKEYFELYGIYYETNEKHKGVRKGAKGMDFSPWKKQMRELEGLEGQARNKNKRDFKRRRVTR